MRRFKLAAALLLILATLICHISVTSAQLSPDPASGPGIRVLAERTPAGINLDRYFVHMGRLFRWLDANADGVLTIADAEYHTAMQLPRLQLSATVEVMRADLNGDGVVTHDEATQMARYEQRSETNHLEKVASQVECWMTADIDGDGRITLAEALKTYRSPAPRSPGSRDNADRVRDALTLSSRGDGQVTLADFENAATALFQTIDVDGDGKISLDEVVAYRRDIENAGSDRRIQAASDAAHQREVAAARASETASPVRRWGC
jgi:Ca2+-binding EF-hand superfamily protein